MKEKVKESISLQVNDLIMEYEKTKYELTKFKIANDRLKNTYSYRLGNALIKSKQSIKDLMRLPKTLLNIKNEIKNQNEVINKKYVDSTVQKLNLPILNISTLIINPVRLEKAVRWYEFDIESLKTFKILHRIYNESLDDINNHEQAVMRVELYDRNNQLITKKENSLFYSKAVGFYKYVDSQTLYSEFKLSNKTKKIKIGFQRWKNKGDIFIDDNIRLFQSAGWSESTLTNNSIPLTHQSIKKYEQLKVACILDELTYECLQHEVSTIKLQPQSWKSEISIFKPDFLLVESCWKGNDNTWGTLTKGSGGARKLSELLNYCKINNIPTVFWNKEDPVHYDKFAEIGALFQNLFTSDVNMVEKYREDFNINVGVLPFAAQPKLHNPGKSKKIIKSKKAVFAGSYYVEKEDRCKDFNSMMDIINEAGLKVDIFDRCFNLDDPRLKFPTKYQGNIKGHLKPEELAIVNNGYQFQINMNTVQHSSSMFARRVFESLASGTPVISNYSKGVEELFGKLVIDTSNREKALARIKELNDDAKLYDDLSRNGVREVMRHHTYRHRIKSICDKIGLHVVIEKKYLTMVVNVKNRSDFDAALVNFNKQTLESKKLLIIMDDFFGYQDLLYKKIKDVNVTMKFSNKFYNNKNHFIGNDFYVELDEFIDLEDTFLEDFYYSNLWADK